MTQPQDIEWRPPIIYKKPDMKVTRVSGIGIDGSYFGGVKRSIGLVASTRVHGVRSDHRMDIFDGALSFRVKWKVNPVVGFEA